MKKIMNGLGCILKGIGCCAVACVVMCLILDALTRIHNNTRLDTTGLVEDVAKDLGVASKDLVLMNEPRLGNPVLIFEYMGESSNILARCTSMASPPKAKSVLPEEDLRRIRNVFREHCEMQKRWLKGTIKAYDLEIEDDFECLYTADGIEAFRKYSMGGELIVATTAWRTYVFCYIMR